MIFFKKKSSKKSIRISGGNNSNKDSIKLLPSAPQQQQQQIYLGSDSWLQLNLPDDFSSSIDIPQLYNKKEESIHKEQLIGEDKSTSGTIDIISNSISISQDKNDNNIYSDSDLLLNPTTSSSSKSFSSSLTGKKTPTYLSPSTVQLNDRNGMEDLAATVEEMSTENHDESSIIVEDNDTNNEADKVQNVGDSLNCPEGEEILTPNYQVINSPKLSDKEEPSVYSTKNNRTDATFAKSEQISHDTRVVAAECTTCTEKAGTAVSSEETKMKDEETKSGPYSGTSQSKLESFHPAALMEQITTPGDLFAGNTMTLADATLVMEEILDEKAGDKNDDFIIEIITSTSAKQGESAIINNKQQRLSILETQLHNPTAAINSLEISSHQKESVFLPPEAQEAKKEGIFPAYRKDNGQAFEKIKKRKSTLSMIPRKQQAVSTYIAFGEDSVAVKTKAALSKIPIISNNISVVQQTPSGPKVLNNVIRRNSSGSSSANSSIPIPNHQQQKQQNRLSLVINTSENIKSCWSSSFPSDNSIKKPLSPIVLTTSSSLSSASQSSSTDSDTTKEEQSSKIQHRSNNINLAQQSNIPTGTAYSHISPSLTLRMLSPPLSKSMSGISRLPKRNSTIV